MLPVRAKIQQGGFISKKQKSSFRTGKISSFQDWFDLFGEFFDAASFHLTQVEGAILNHFDGWDTLRNWDNHVAHLLNEWVEFIAGNGLYAQEHEKCKLDFTDLFNVWTPLGHISMINFFDAADVAVCTGADDSVGECGYFTH